MLAAQRHERILDKLRTDGAVEVKVLSDLLGVSEATIRRDLVRLESRGAVHRLHGGASLSTTHEAPFEEVASNHLAARTAVARAAADLVADGDVVLLDIGTTTHQVARYLRGRPITVITSNMAVYEELAGDPVVELIVLGGVVRRNYRSLVGFLTIAALGQIHADMLFLGTSGVRPDGTVLDTTVVEVPVKQAMLGAANRTVLLADSRKFPGSGLARVCGPTEVSTLVTNADADATTLASFRDAGTDVRLVGPPPAPQTTSDRTPDPTPEASPEERP